MRQMRISLRNQVLAGLLLIQAIVITVVFWPRSAGAGSSGPLFPGLEASQVTRVTIRDASGKRVELAKEGEGWVLASAEGYPCMEGKVPALLDKLVAIQTDRLVTQTRASHKRLKVAGDDFLYEVSLETADGTVRTLYLGTSPSYSATHVRVDGQDRVYLAAGLASADVSTRATGWIDALYFSIPADQIQAVTLENASGSLSMEKQGDVWVLDGLSPGETADEAAISSLVSRLASVRMLLPLGKEAQESYGMQSPQAVVRVQAQEEGGLKTYVLTVGAKSSEDESYVLKSDSSPYYVRVASYTAEEWVTATRENFLEVAPTPEATVTPEPTATPEATPTAVSRITPSVTPTPAPGTRQTRASWPTLAATDCA
jgi:hypothetical protein